MFRLVWIGLPLRDVIVVWCGNGIRGAHMQAWHHWDVRTDAAPFKHTIRDSRDVPINPVFAVTIQIDVAGLSIGRYQYRTIQVADGDIPIGHSCMRIGPTGWYPNTVCLPRSRALLVSRYFRCKIIPGQKPEFTEWCMHSRWMNAVDCTWMNECMEWQTNNLHLGNLDVISLSIIFGGG